MRLQYWSLCRAAMMIVALASCTSSQALAEAPLKVLIIDGRNNHEWEKTTPALKGMLEATGRFRVESVNRQNRLDERPTSVPVR